MSSDWWGWGKANLLGKLPSSKWRNKLHLSNKVYVVNQRVIGPAWRRSGITNSRAYVFLLITWLHIQNKTFQKSSPKKPRTTWCNIFYNWSMSFYHEHSTFWVTMLKVSALPLVPAWLLHQTKKKTSASISFQTTLMWKMIIYTNLCLLHLKGLRKSGVVGPGRRGFGQTGGSSPPPWSMVVSESESARLLFTPKRCISMPNKGANQVEEGKEQKKKMF